MKHIYPTCAKTFKEWCRLNPQYINTFQKIGKPVLFDVSLRDGIQALTKKEQEQFTLKEKLKYYELIKTKYEPENIEIGSIVSEKVLPVFKDSLELLSLLTINKQEQKQEQEQVINNYLLIPNKEKLQSIISNKNVNHISLISSVSSSFQLKNTRKTLEQSYKELCEMLSLLSDIYKTVRPKIKLYVSCINECPIAGSIDNDFIVSKLLNLYKLNIDE
jgi:isopropylmalate/homocitrate/citramalate synthase